MQRNLWMRIPGERNLSRQSQLMLLPSPLQNASIAYVPSSNEPRFAALKLVWES